jgi:putative phage-type endonuclease
MEVDMISKIKTNSRAEWLALRKQYIGGSDAAAVVGMNPFSSPFSLWAEKVGRAPEFEGNLATEVGSFLEEFVAKKFERETGKTVRRCNLSLVNDKYPWAIANVDRLIVGEDAGLEIKTTSELNMKSFKNGEYPGNYYCQCCHYLSVTGKARWYLAVLIGNREFRIFTIERDEGELKALMDAEREFWNTYVLTGKTPPVDGHSATGQAIRDMFQVDAGGSADLSSLEDVFIRRKAINEQIRALKTDLDGLDNQVKVAMGSASSGVCGRYSVSWKLQASSALDRDKIHEDFPELDFSQYAKQARVFRVTEKKQRTA